SEEILGEEIINDTFEGGGEIADGNFNETENEITEEIVKEKIKTKKVQITAQVVSGKISAEIDLKKKNSLSEFFRSIFKKITGKVVDVEESEEIKEVIIDENATEFEIEYETPAPFAVEKNTSYGKEIVVSSEAHCANILAYAELPKPVPESQIKLYHYDNGTKVLTDFVAYSAEDVVQNKTRVAAIENETAVGSETTDENVVRESMSITGNVIGGEISAEKNITAEEISNENEIAVGNFSEETSPPAETINDNQTVVEVSNESEIAVGNFSEETNATEIQTEENNLTAEINSTEKLISYIEWIVPHLSNQTYDIVIWVNYTYRNPDRIRDELNFSHLALNDSSLVLYMPFDTVNDSTNITYDYTDNDNDGTIINGVLWNSSGKYGGAYQFDGVDDYVNLGNPASLNVSNTTIVAWYKSNNTGEYGGIVARSNQDAELFHNGNTLSIWSTTEGWHHSATHITDGNWHHLVGVFSSGVTSGSSQYIDGILDANSPFTWTRWTTAADWNIGLGHPGEYVNGIIDEVMIFNRSLSADEVMMLYNSTYPRFYSEGNQTFKAQNVVAGPDRASVSVEGEALNGSALSARVYEVNLSDSSNPSPAYVNTEDGLVGYWHFDNWSSYGENSTYVYDFSGRNHNMTVSGAVWNSVGKYQGAFDFDGGNDYSNASGFSGLKQDNTSFSFVGWVKLASGETNGNIIHMSSVADGTGWCLPPISLVDGKLVGMTWNSVDGNKSATGTTNLVSGQWYHFASTWDPVNGITIYVNGNLEDENSIYSYEYTSETEPYIFLGIGTSGACVGDKGFFNGTIDEVMIFNRSLGDEEIKSLYITGSVDHKNDGVGINWTESSSGAQNLGFLNATNKNSVFIINTSSDWLLPELNFNSGSYNFYSPFVKSAILRLDFEREVTACGILNTSNTIYTLMNNVTSNSTCFNITANNVTLIGNGYTVNYSANGTAGNGVLVNTYNFTTIKNLKIVEGNPAVTEGVASYFYKSYNSKIINNSIISRGVPLYLYYSDNCNVTDNYLQYSDFVNAGYTGILYLYFSNNASIYNNTLYTDS
ncbi:MAG: LamG domain-containing protein, partial [Candidatus Diapherotrites archaeon]